MQIDTANISNSGLHRRHVHKKVHHVIILKMSHLVLAHLEGGVTPGCLAGLPLTIRFVVPQPHVCLHVDLLLEQLVASSSTTPHFALETKSETDGWLKNIGKPLLGFFFDLQSLCSLQPILVDSPVFQLMGGLEMFNHDFQVLKGAATAWHLAAYFIFRRICLILAFRLLPPIQRLHPPFFGSDYLSQV